MSQDELEAASVAAKENFDQGFKQEWCMADEDCDSGSTCFYDHCTIVSVEKMSQSWAIGFYILVGLVFVCGIAGFLRMYCAEKKEKKASGANKE